WPCALLSVSSLCQLKFIVRQALGLVKRKGPGTLLGTLLPCHRVCKAPHRGAAAAPTNACYTSALFCSENSLSNGRVYLSIRYAGGRSGDANGRSARR